MVNYLIEDNSATYSDKKEVKRIYDSFRSRVEDLFSNYARDINAKLVINPNDSEIIDSVSLKEGLFFQSRIPVSMVFDSEQLSMLKGKLTFFQFSGKGVKNLLFSFSEVSDMTCCIEKEVLPLSKLCLDATTISSLKYFQDKYPSGRRDGGILCFFGPSGAGKTSLVLSFANELNHSIENISITKLISDKNYLSKLITKNQSTKVMYFIDSADSLFVDINSVTRIQSVELSIVRSIIVQLIEDEKILIAIAISDISCLTPEFITRVILPVKLEMPSFDLRKSYFHSTIGDTPKIDLLVKHTHGFSFSRLRQLVEDIKTSSILGGSLDKSIDFCLNEHLKIYDKINAINGLDYKIINPKISIDRVIISERNKESLMVALSSIIHKELLNNIWKWNEIDSYNRSIINFYGPPGTGKTMCANAIATELTKRTGRKYELLALNYSEIESMYVGEAPKKLEKVFNFSRSKDIVLFFDEADSFLGKRITNVSHGAEQAINSLRSTMLIQLEQYTGVVIFATNLTCNYDFAFKTRFLAEIEFTMPDANNCVAIFLNNLPTPIKRMLQDEDISSLGIRLEGLSGRDIKTVIWRTLSKAAHYNGAGHIFSLSDFITEIEVYRNEKKISQSNDGDIINNIQTNVTPECKKLKDKLTESNDGVNN